MTDDNTIEKIIVSIEGMIRALDDMHEEKKYSNYREQEKIRNDRYAPARAELKATLTELLRNK